MICTSALFKVFVVSNSSTNRQSNQRMNRFLKIVSCRHTSVEYFEHNPRTRNRLGTGNDFPFASSHENDDPRATFARDTFFFFLCPSQNKQSLHPCLCLDSCRMRTVVASEIRLIFFFLAMDSAQRNGAPGALSHGRSSRKALIGPVRSDRRLWLVDKHISVCQNWAPIYSIQRALSGTPGGRRRWRANPKGVSRFIRGGQSSRSSFGARPDWKWPARVLKRSEGKHEKDE